MGKTTVTDLSKLAVCEKQHVLGKIHGVPENELMKQGTQNHNAFEHSSWRRWERELKGQKRCYVATSLWGQEDWRVLFLRKYRDEVLLKNKAGIIFIKFYYLISEPLVNSWLFKKKWIKAFSAIIIEFIIKCLSI